MFRWLEKIGLHRLFLWLVRRGLVKAENEQRAVHDVEDLIEIASDRPLPPPPLPGPPIGTEIQGDPNQAAEQLNKIEADSHR